MFKTCDYRQQTKSYEQKINVIFNETIIFDRIFLSPNDFNQGFTFNKFFFLLFQISNKGEILLRMMHKPPFYKFPELIGEFSCNLSSIYNLPRHECRNKWLVLMRPNKAKVIYGFLKIDVFVIGEGDPLPAYDLEKDEDYEDEVNNSLCIYKKNLN